MSSSSSCNKKRKLESGEGEKNGDSVLLFLTVYGEEYDANVSMMAILAPDVLGKTVSEAFLDCEEYCEEAKRDQRWGKLTLLEVMRLPSERNAGDGTGSGIKSLSLRHRAEHVSFDD